MLSSNDPSLSINSIQAEIQKLLASEAVLQVAEEKGMEFDELKTLQVKIKVDDQPAFSPGDLATLAITIIILNPLGNAVKEATIEIWKEIVFPRLKSWAEAHSWSLESASDLDFHIKGDETMLGTKLSVLDPSLGKVISSIKTTNVTGVDQAVQRARLAQSTWKLVPAEEKIALFAKLSELLSDNSDKLIALIGQETGKRKSDAEYEVFDIIDGIAHFSRQLRLITSQDRTVPTSFLPHGTKFNTMAQLRLEPHGVAAVIMPWNFPFWIPMANLIPLLLAGNTAVFKPSESSSLVGQAIKGLFDKAGFPKSVLELVIGADAVGKALVNSSVDIIVFTGSVEAGLDVKRNAGMRPVELELGGNTASIVCKDAPLNLAVEGTVWGALYNVGQSCSGHKRVFVHKDVAEEFTQMVIDKVGSLKPGVDYGPYITKDAMNTVDERIKDAIKRGAELKIGGHPLGNLPPEYKNGNWYAPTVLVYTNDELSIISQETFGNVLPIRVVESDEEAIQLANNTSYGLNNVIWTNDHEKGENLAEKLESGMVFINEAELALVAGEYWGGWKNSGLGSIGTKLERSFKQQLIITYTGSEPREYWFPYDK